MLSNVKIGDTIQLKDGDTLIDYVITCTDSPHKSSDGTHLPIVMHTDNKNASIKCYSFSKNGRSKAEGAGPMTIINFNAPDWNQERAF